MSLDLAMAAAAKAVEEQLDRLPPLTEGAERRLHEAMRYSTLAGGKRLRPFLVLESASLFNVARSCALRVAAAVEMIHSYSLVHDDLPAMDDSALRRGRATTHVQFDEATAILAGDGLLTRALEVLADPASHGDPQVRVELIAALAQAAGPAGMVGGQMFDLLAEHDSTLDIGAITRLQRMKTGELIAFSSVAGAILGKASYAQRLALSAYAHDLGLAFQIADDLLDAEGDAAEVGKDVGKDADAGKATFVSILGLERARDQAALLADQAADHLEPFKEKAELLRQVARFVVTRRH
ncbi:MAG: polyprenyl synthetase family protein [Alphaproteobacteria bacterium]|nr:polyprenyl synthetase family protein [Alphaproteobacteria bacterium]